VPGWMSAEKQARGGLKRPPPAAHRIARSGHGSRGGRLAAWQVPLRLVLEPHVLAGEFENVRWDPELSFGLEIKGRVRWQVA
jgi:hypothetical protein